MREFWRNIMFKVIVVTKKVCICINIYLLPSGMISTPSLNHLTSASSSSHSNLNSTLSSSTQFLLSSLLVNLWGNSKNVSKDWNYSSLSYLNRYLKGIEKYRKWITIPPIVTSQEVSPSPSLANSSILQVYLPASSSLASLMVRVWTPSSFSIRMLGSDFETGTPSLYHLTLASGLSTLHLSLTCFLVWPCFLSSNFFLNPYSGSGAVDIIDICCI